MIKSVGALLIAAVSFYLPLSWCRAWKQSVDTLTEYALALEQMARLLEQCGADTAQLLESGRERAPFLGNIDLNCLRQRSFSCLWQEALREVPSELASARDILLPLGQILGSCSAEEQRTALLGAAARLRLEAEKRAKKQPENRRLWYTLSLSGGAMILLLAL